MHFLEAMLNGWWQGIVLTLLVWLVLRDMPRISAATRLAIWHVTLLIVLLLPGLQRISLPSWSSTTEADVRPVAVPSVASSETPLPYAAPVEQPRPLPRIEINDSAFPQVAFGLALFLGCVQLLRLVFGYWMLRRLKRKATLSGIELPVQVGRPVTVLTSEKIGMPMAVGYRRPAILLPASLAERLTPQELHHVLLHESAHLRRKDDWMALGERFIRAIFFFQPAVHWIARQIERERELACDDWVIAQSGDTKPYANALARVAELAAPGSIPILATGAGKPKQIFARLETLLDRTRNRVPSVSEPLVMLAGLLLLLAVFQGAQFSHLFGFSDFDSRWVESDGTNRLEFKTRGEIRFTASDDDVERVSPGGMLVIAQADGWNNKRIEIEADDQGNLKRRFYTSGSARPFDAEAQRFLAKMLPRWVREFGNDVPERTARIIRDKGTDGSLEEIRKIRRANVKRSYLEELFVQAVLSPEQFHRVLKIAGEIGSYDEKQRFLEHVPSKYLTPEADSQLLTFIDGINSGDARRVLLGQAIERKGGAEIGTRLFRSIGLLLSDEAKTDLLMKSAELSKAHPPESFFSTLSSIHSEQHRERLLNMILTAHGDDPATVTRVLRAASDIHSDGEKSRILLSGSRGFRGSEDTLREAARVLSSMHSDGERRACLQALIEADGKNAETLREVLLQTATMGSDSDKSHLLLKVADGFVEQEPVRLAFFSALRTIHSSEDQRRVLLAVLSRPSLDPETLRAVTRSASGLPSHEDRNAVLTRIAERQ